MNKRFIFEEIKIGTMVLSDTYCMIKTFRHGEIMVSVKTTIYESGYISQEAFIDLPKLKIDKKQLGIMMVG